VILLVNGSLYVDGTRQSWRHVAHQERDSRLREAVFCGARWSGRAAQAGLAEGRASLTLAGARVEVSHTSRSTADGVEVLVTSSARDFERRLVLKAVLRASEGAFRVHDFELIRKGP
jgi:hypothetical protein